MSLAAIQAAASGKSNQKGGKHINHVCFKVPTSRVAKGDLYPLNKSITPK